MHDRVAIEGVMLRIPAMAAAIAWSAAQTSGPLLVRL
jgi:hypothetical protein